MSLAVHLTVLSLLALLQFGSVTLEPTADLDATLPELATAIPMTTLGPTAQVTVGEEKPDGRESGGRAAGMHSSEQSISTQPARIPSPFGEGVSLYEAILGSMNVPGRLGEVVGAIEESDDEDEGDGGDGGSGTGTGTGRGAGAGSGFFGTKATGLSVVYVVDASRSMNHPHASPAKTRFKRLKLELVKSIMSMPSDAEFFIIFFNDEAIPMPAATLQAASESNKRRYLSWMAEAKADRETDPRKALSIALKMRPDVIFFLTDGSFDRPVERDLLKLSQRRSTIHTFAFGTDAGNETMRAIAKANGGKYHYVP